MPCLVTKASVFGNGVLFNGVADADFEAFGAFLPAFHVKQALRSARQGGGRLRVETQKLGKGRGAMAEIGVNDAEGPREQGELCIKEICGPTIGRPAVPAIRIRRCSRHAASRSARAQSRRSARFPLPRQLPTVRPAHPPRPSACRDRPPAAIDRPPAAIAPRGRD